MQENPLEQEDSSLHFLDYWRVIRSRKEIILAVTLLVIVTGVAFTLTLPKIYMAESRIKIQEDALDVEVFSRQYLPSYNHAFIRTEFEVIQSRPILEKVIENLDLRRIWGEELSPDGTPLTIDEAHRTLKRSLSVHQYRDTTLIAIVVRGEIPSEITRVANELAQVYREQRIRDKVDEVKGGITALSDELTKQRDIVNQAESYVETLRNELDISVISSGFRIDDLMLQRLEGDRITARVEMLARKARLDQLKPLSGEELMNTAPFLVADPTLANIRKQLIDSEVSLQLLLQNYGTNHPDVMRLKAAVTELKSKLNDALDGLQRGLAAEYEMFKARYDTLASELDVARQGGIQAQRERYLPFERAQRDLNVQRSILNALQARVAQEGIEMGVPRTPVKIVDEAVVPRQPVSPNFLLNILLSIALGLGAGVALAFFIEYLDTSVKTVDDVERHLGLPVVGVIPQKVHHLIEEGPDSPHAESYRVLRTNLQFNNRSKHGGAFVVTSGGVGEGKSTTLSNLAYICSILGDKVLIVDSDMRRPVQHHILGMDNRTGLADALSGQIPLEELIQPTKAPNLHFLPSGKLTRSMVGMLDPERIRELIADLKNRYDYVFFDSPPLMGVSDASVLASEVDGVLLVVQYRKYPRVISSRARRILDSVGANVVGVVLNNINIMRDDYYYYYHSYHSHYYAPVTEEDAEPTQADGSKKEQVF